MVHFLIAKTRYDLFGLGFRLVWRSSVRWLAPFFIRRDHARGDATGEIQADLRGHQRTVNSLSFSSDNRKLASGGEDSTILIWDLAASPPK